MASFRDVSASGGRTLDLLNGVLALVPGLGWVMNLADFFGMVMVVPPGDDAAVVVGTRGGSHFRRRRLDGDGNGDLMTATRFAVRLDGNGARARRVHVVVVVHAPSGLHHRELALRLVVVHTE